DAEAARDPLEGGESVVGLVHDHDLALRLFAKVERGEHPREHEYRIGAGPEERAGDPAVGVGRLAEARDVALDAAQVLEVGRRREEERVDALGLHPRGEPPPALLVVEHRTRVYDRAGTAVTTM